MACVSAFTRRNLLIFYGLISNLISCSLTFLIISFAWKYYAESPHNAHTDVSRFLEEDCCVCGNPVIDVYSPNCRKEDLYDDYRDFIMFSGSAEDMGEDINQNGVLDPGEDINGNGELDADSGIFTVELLSGSFNLQLEPFNFTEGDSKVIFTATRIEDSKAANGTIVVHDGANKSCSLDVSLEPFDQAIFDTITGFPAAAHLNAFGTESEEYPTYTIESLDEQPGVYNAMYETTNTPFLLTVETIITPSSDILSNILNDPNVTQNVLDFIQEKSYTSFIFGGVLDAGVEPVRVAALAYSVAAMSSNYSVIVIFDPEDRTNNQTRRQLRNDESESLYFADSMLSILNPTKHNVLNEHQDQSKRYLKELCPSGIDYVTCLPQQQRQVDQVCITAARIAFDTAVNAAQGKYDLAILFAKNLKALVTAAWNIKKAKDLAKQLIPCVLIGLLSGPFGYGLCVARVVAINAAKFLAGKLAIEAGFELSKRNALTILNAAIDAACGTYRSSIRACVTCGGEPCDRSSDCSSEEFPDPHFRTWNNDYYDFHGACDMIHVRNEVFELHIRTERRQRWSAVNRAALRFESDILEVLDDGSIFINGVKPTATLLVLDEIYPIETSSNSVTVRMSGAQFIQFKSYYQSLLIRIDGHGSDFYDSVGMAGTWNKFGLVGRDRNTTYTNTTLFALDWEVDDNIHGDPLLFSTPAVSFCNGTSFPQMQPTLDELNFAEAACEEVTKEGEKNRENCIFDILASDGDVTWVDNPAYTDPFQGTERCVDATINELEGKASCRSLGGECVFRCDTSELNCLDDATLCDVGDVNLRKLNEYGHQGRRLNVLEGCSCALPKNRTVDGTSCQAAIGPIGLKGDRLYATNDNATEITASCGLSNDYYSGQSIWYYFVGTGRTITITTCDEATDFNTFLYLYEASSTEAEIYSDLTTCDDKLACITYQDNSGSNQCPTNSFSSTIWLNTEKDKVYYLAVLGVRKEVGIFGLHIYEETNNCENAEGPIPTNGTVTVGTNKGLEIMGPSCSITNTYYSGPGKWYYFVGTGRTITITTCDEATDFNTFLYLYEASSTEAEIYSDPTTCRSDAMCASGVCVSGLCQDGVQEVGEACDGSVDCGNSVCAHESSDRASPFICCPSGELVSIRVSAGTNDVFCTGQPEGAACRSNAMCASSVCDSGICL
eukprot:CAMPEP_0178897448 /NCGR_PEP_ID=MMETSP0786-20121207/1753_1 /TAXON_ID=186022 /ORGANISM="Thalassionema frauenfeldii, Strain CCMP 1798" /LENGTH=1177 /DNA_ID=CAMNT_0020568001 /DNA_START=35 /DNA_END=3568 /DNA_ORIENTATION=-